MICQIMKGGFRLSLAAFGHPEAFALSENGFQWLGDYGITADEVLGGIAPKANKMEQAKRLLRELAETNNAMQSNEGQLAKEILCEFMEQFQKRNPNLYVFSSHLHMDEQPPHIHIDFVPFIRNSKRGQSKVLEQAERKISIQNVPLK